MTAYGDNASSLAACKRWLARFLSGTYSIYDKPRSERPPQLDIERLRAILEANSYGTTRKMARELGCSQATNVVTNEVIAGTQDFVIYLHRKTARLAGGVNGSTAALKTILCRELVTREFVYDFCNIAQSLPFVNRLERSIIFQVNQSGTQYPEKVNVWAGIINSQIIGSYFFDGTLTGARYLDFLQNFLNFEKRNALSISLYSRSTVIASRFTNLPTICCFCKICKPKTHIFLIRFYLLMRRHLLDGKFLIEGTIICEISRIHML
ncbi:hypothetical protein NQ318_013669 [Aromia moschata]|uniref:Uncharacterized protein n=1 Tax=Aromia moschata TaxID=1265417 RepID=A0AAV8Y015_9CUCU|nr:hypothetical protein NQ318_013669 [Aromia moschata]